MSSAPIRFILVFGRNESPNTCSVTTRCISGQMRNMHLLLLPRFRYLPSVIGRSNPAGICRQSQTQPVLPPIPDHAVYPISSIGRYHAPIQPYQDDHLIILSARFRPMRGGGLSPRRTMCGHLSACIAYMHGPFILTTYLILFLCF